MIKLYQEKRAAGTECPVRYVPALGHVTDHALVNVYVSTNGVPGARMSGLQPSVFDNPPEPKPPVSRHAYSPALFISINEERLTYDGPRLLLERRSKRAKLNNKPKLHGFRRTFALDMLRSGVDIFVLQRLGGHSELEVLRRYLAQNDEDNHLAHMRGSPVDNNL